MVTSRLRTLMTVGVLVGLLSLGRSVMAQARLEPSEPSPGKMGEVARLFPGTSGVGWTVIAQDDNESDKGRSPFLVAGSMGTSDTGVPQRAVAEEPPLKIVAPANRETVSNPVVVVIETPADLPMMTMGHQSMDKTKLHLHVDLDKRMTMPTTEQIIKVGTNRYQTSLGEVPPGRHTIRVYWADAQHARRGATHTVTITVK